MLHALHAGPGGPALIKGAIEPAQESIGKIFIGNWIKNGTAAKSELKESRAILMCVGKLLTFGNLQRKSIEIEQAVALGFRPCDSCPLKHFVRMSFRMQAVPSSYRISHSLSKGNDQRSRNSFAFIFSDEQV